MAEETAKQEEVKEEAAAPAEESKEEKKEVPAKFKALVDQISELSVLDLAELVKASWRRRPQSSRRSWPRWRPRPACGPVCAGLERLGRAPGG